MITTRPRARGSFISAAWAASGARWSSGCWASCRAPPRSARSSTCGAATVRDNERCACNQRFHDCPFWHEVGALAFGGWDRVDVARIEGAAGRPSSGRFIPRLAAPCRPGPSAGAGRVHLVLPARLCGAAAASGCEVLIDSSKHSSLAFCLRWLGPRRLRVVHVVRDSRAVAYSWTRLIRRPDAAAASYLTRYSPAVSAGCGTDTTPPACWPAAACRCCGCGTRTWPRTRRRCWPASPASPGCPAARTPGRPGRRPRAVVGRARPGAHRGRQPDAVHHRPGPDHDGQPLADCAAGRDRRLVTGLTLPLLAGYGYLRGAA